MKKFKVIEESRFLKKNEMPNIKGGGSCNGVHYVLCTNQTGHGGACISFPLNYLSTPCAREHGTCGIMTLYNGFCERTNESCNLIQIYGVEA